MLNNRFYCSAVFTLGMIAFPSLVQAGTTTAFSITFEVPATAVPALSNPLLIALGLLLVVLAARTLHANKGAQKFLSVALMAGGLAIGGVGVDRAVAQGAVSYIFGPEDRGCEDVESVGYNRLFSGNSVVNNCDDTATVTAFSNSVCFPINDDGDCGQLAPGASCTLPTANDECG
ncbi:MAG: hypothetical protein ACI9JM_003430 [Halioglobus sp.]|jgi:hypothetical protein